MAGRGPAPKEPDQRRRSNAPSRGEWVDIPLERAGKIPSLGRRPSGGAWLASTKAAWEAWWADGASSTWGRAEQSSVRQLAFLFDEVERGALKYAAEVRLRMDGLGLTPKGKRDLRLRVESEPIADDGDGARNDEVAARRQERQARLAAGV